MSRVAEILAEQYLYKRQLHDAYEKYVFTISTDDFKALPKTPENKGEKGKNCNRTACQTHGATWYNLSTRAYYCAECALLINEANMMDAVKLYGHPFLCVSPLDTAHYPQ